MERPKVYIIQEPLKNQNGVMVPVFDFRSVVEYGDPVICLPTGRVALTPGPTIDKLWEVLKDFTDNDYIVSVGDPSAIFAAAMILSFINIGKAKILKWDKKHEKYICVNMDIHYRTRRGE